ncbi:MAG: hypothetical protein JWL91_2656 [Sphingomonas bacterium]|nr:hypothetical protein [Sphingomonas bacterium]
MGMGRKARKVVALAGLSALALMAAQSRAQAPDEPQTSPDPAASADAANPAEIVVTGSRIVRRDYNAPSPIVTVGESFLDTQAGGTFGIKLQQLPQATPGGNELTGSGQPTGRASIDLRGLGANRTLVLADGRRLQPSTSSVIVDLNTIPTALVDNIEVITGGASAIYGSDAISGVVNLKLKQNFQGVELSGQYNLTELGDGREYFIDGLVGGNFAENRGNAVLSISYLDRGAAYFNKRRFYREAFALGAPPWGSDLLPQGNFVPDPANLPAQSRLDQVFAGYGVAAGRVPNSAVLSFNTDARNTLFSQTGGINYAGPYNDQFVLSPFNNSVAYNLGTLQLLTTPTQRINLFGSTHFDITDDVTIYAQGLFTDYSAVTNYGAGLQTQGTTAVVPADNAFIPADLARILAARPNPNAPFAMRKLWTATGTSVTTYDNSVYQILGGLRGKIGGSGWRWDIYGSHGETKIDVTQTSGSASFSRIQQLLTSRSRVAADGSLVNVPVSIASANGSNSQVPNPAYATAANDGGRSLAANGARPCPEGLDIFGDTPLTDSCSQFLQIHPTSITRIKQTVAEGTLSGSAFALPYGDVQIAIGATYRKNSYLFTPDPAGADLVGSFGSQAVSGATTAKEAYGEVLLPILRDVPGFRSLDVSLAYRYSDYLSGGVSAYKGDVDWAVVEGVRLRGGYQRAVRAPNVVEYFNPAVAGPALLGGQGDPCNFDSGLRTGANATQVRALCLAQGLPASIIDTYKSAFAGTQAIQQGNLALSPEKADTYTGGIVLRPRFDTPMFRRLSLSVDYYQIDLADAISTLSADLVFARCFNTGGDNPEYSQQNANCQSILRNPGSGAPDQTLTPYFNLGGIRTNGIDFQFDWGFALETVGLGSAAGQIDFNVVASRLLEFKVQASAGAPWVEYAGTYGYSVAGFSSSSNNGSHPKWKANSAVTWSTSQTSLGLRWFYVGPMRDIVGGPGLTDYSRFDLFGGFHVTNSFVLSAGVNNLFDKQPLKTFGGLPGNTDSGTYDPLGRRYFISAKLNFK